MRGNILLWGRQTTNSTTAMLQKANRQHFYHFFRAFLSLFRPNIEQKTPVAPSFFKIEQNKQHHRTPSKKYTTLGGLKSFLPRIKQMQCPKMHFESISQRPKRGRKRAENAIFGLKMAPLAQKSLSTVEGGVFCHGKFDSTIYLDLSAKLRNLWLIIRFWGSKNRRKKAKIRDQDSNFIETE